MKWVYASSAAMTAASAVLLAPMLGLRQVGARKLPLTLVLHIDVLRILTVHIFRFYLETGSGIKPVP